MPAMLEFASALAAFLVSHRLPAATNIRQWCVERMGESAYRAVYGVFSILVLAWLISAAIRAPVVMLWWPQTWHAAIPLVVMPIAVVLITAGAISPNPLSISFRSQAYDPAHPGIVAVTRHPVLWGFALWALSHLVANGDVVSFVLFGGLGVFALHGMSIFDRRLQQRLGDAEWHRLACDTSVIPFVAVCQGKTRLAFDGRIAVAILAGFTVYAWFLLHGHGVLIGADPLGRF